MIRVKVYKLTLLCVENGVQRGLRLAYKHTEAPSREVIVTSIEQEVMNELSEFFEFEEVAEKG